MFTNDPVRDAERYYDSLDAQLEKYPVCTECGERIQDDECYEFDGQLICSECLKDNHRRYTDDFIDD